MTWSKMKITTTTTTTKDYQYIKYTTFFSNIRNQNFENKKIIIKKINNKLVQAKFFFFLTCTWQRSVTTGEKKKETFIKVK